jgi:NAD(P)-dependent dehydrogenase (short-subunit alcohol dehydrogenase family)
MEFAGNVAFITGGGGVGRANARNRFRRPDGAVVADSSRNRLSTRSIWRATGADGAGFARRYWSSPNSANLFKGTQLNLSSNGSHTQKIAARHWVFI